MVQTWHLSKWISSVWSDYDLCNSLSDCAIPTNYKVYLLTHTEFFAEMFKILCKTVSFFSELPIQHHYKKCLYLILMPIWQTDQCLGTILTNFSDWMSRQPKTKMAQIRIVQTIMAHNKYPRQPNNKILLLLLQIKCCIIYVRVYWKPSVYYYNLCVIWSLTVLYMQ